MPDSRRAEALGSGLPPLLVAAERVANTVSQGVHGRRRVGQGDSFWQYRPFTPGDSATRIDWRQSAKASRAYIRETEWEAAQTVCLWRDAGAGMRWRSSPSLPEKSERAGLLLLALASLLLRGGERVRLVDADPAARRGAASGRAALDGLAQALSLSEAAGRAGTAADAGLPPRAELPRHARVVLLGDFLGPLDAVRATVAALAAIPVTGHLVQVLDPAETALPYSGRVRFRDVAGRSATARSAAVAGPGPGGGGAEVLVPRVEGLREAYAEALAAQQAGLASICRTAGFGFAVHHTDQPPERALLALYAALSGPAGGAANGAANSAGGPGFAAGGGTAGAGAQEVASGVAGTDADGAMPGRAARPVRGA
jgi:uncharacterized protein (DUF58 family)